eukprot:COSAG01_NODE_2656_length_7304_cov_56.354615_6_plen_215_part_00
MGRCVHIDCRSAQHQHFRGAQGTTATCDSLGSLAVAVTLMLAAAADSDHGRGRLLAASRFARRPRRRRRRRRLRGGVRRAARRRRRGGRRFAMLMMTWLAAACHHRPKRARGKHRSTVNFVADCCAGCLLLHQTSIPGNRRSTRRLSSIPQNAPHSGDGAAVPGHPIPTGSRLHRPAPASEAVQAIHLAPVGPTLGPPHHSPTPRPPRGEGSLR